MTTNTTKKITKTEMFNTIAAVCETAMNAELITEEANATYRAFLSKQVADIAKKNAARKSAVNSAEGVALKTAALSIIAASATPINVKEMFKVNPTFAEQAGYSAQKVTAILTKAVEAGEVAKAKVKGLTVYSMPIDSKEDAE